MSISLYFSAFFLPGQGGQRAAGVLLALSVAAVGAQTGFPYAAGTDTTGRAQAVSDAAGRVMIESPEFPRGLWVDLTDEAGQALAGIQVEYQGRADSLVAIWSVDPSGHRQETLLWTRAGEDPLRLTLQEADPPDLPPGLTSVDWRIAPGTEGLLGLEERPDLVGWEAVTAFLQERWQGRTGRVAVQIDSSTVLAVDLDHPEPVTRLVDHLQDRTRKSLGEVGTSFVQVRLSPYAIKEALPLLDSIVLTASYVLVPGSDLEKWVLTELGRPGPAAWSEASELTRLNLARRQIVDVSPLAALTSLEGLDLGYNEIVDVSPLASLTDLKQLDLRKNEIVDVSPLASLTDLKQLDLRKNEIVDMSPLAALTGLERLNLSGNPLVDVSPLAALAGLDWLSLGELYGRIVDVSPLAALTNLDTLHLHDNLLVDVRPLAALSELDVLDLSSNWIEDISSLAAITGLERLHLSGNQIVDVSPLAALPGLKVLTLAGQYDSDGPTLGIGSLASLTGLEQLNLASNELVDVGPLAVLTSLQSLILYDNYISDLAPLAALTKLGYLDLKLNWIEDIGPLAALTSTEVLILNDNGIVDVGPLAALTKLGYLDLDWNRIEDISPLGRPDQHAGADPE